MNLRLWPEKIWPVCPELRPEFKAYGFHKRTLRHSPESMVPWRLQHKFGAMELTQDVAASLIFAKAVLWLADNNGSVGLERLYGGGYGVLFVTTKPVAEASTPIEAAYLAVCHVLKVTP